MDIDIFSAAAYGEYETIDEILRTSTNQLDLLNSQDAFGLTALMEACRNNRKETVQYLLSHNANPNIQDKSGCTALHYAVTDAHIDIVHLLVESGININIIDYCGKTALHYASQKERDDVVTYLIAHNADMSIRDKEGNLPVMWMNSYKYLFL